ncbi:MAG: hypothetical protein AB7O97_00650 [Planctomycetota bacterium]
MLVDLEALQAQARERGGELSFRKLLKGIAHGCPVEQAVCFVTRATAPSVRRSLTAAGFALREHETATEAQAAMAEAALSVRWPIDALVLAPLGARLESHVDELAGGGFRIEVASFDGTAPSGAVARRLGPGCLFVP